MKRIHTVLFSLFIIFSIILFNSCASQTSPKYESEHQQVLSIIDFGSSLLQPEVVFQNNAPSRITRKVKQDQEGNLLFASYEGIIHYDGETFTNITKEKGLEECYAFDGLEDRNGNIWIASDQEGVYRINGLTDEITHFTTEDGLGHRRNMCIYEDRAGNIWVGGQGGLSRFDGESFVNFTTEDGMPHNDVNIIQEDSKGNIWFGTRGNAGVYDGKVFKEIRNVMGMPFFNVWSITEDQKGNIWLADSAGLWSYNGIAFTHVSRNVWGIYEDSKGTFWSTNMPRFGPGTLMRIDANSLFSKEVKMVEVFKANGIFLGMTEDRKGNIWIGGGDGAWRYDGETVTYFTGKQEKD